MVSRAESVSVYLAVFGLLDEFRLTSVSSGITVLVCLLSGQMVVFAKEMQRRFWYLGGQLVALTSVS